MYNILKSLAFFDKMLYNIYYNICKYAGTGRQARLRGVCINYVWVQVPLLAPTIVKSTDMKVSIF